MERRRGNAQIGVAVNDLNNNITKFLRRARVSYLLGIPQEELRRGGIGIGSCGARWKRRRDVLHHEEMRRICQFAYSVRSRRVMRSIPV